MNLPKKFTDEMKTLLGDEFPDFLDSYTRMPRFGLRVNTDKISVRDFLELTDFKLEPIPWVENGFFYDAASSVTKHPHYHAGLYYIQEPSAMVPASRLPVNEGDRILDLCAAPGGKATELAARLHRNGLLIANDISASRSKALLKNLELFGAGNIIVTSEEPERLVSRFPEFFDKILIDAPCSGEGMFRKEPSMVKSWEERGPEYYAAIQKEILCQAADMLKPGGSLLFSTCTFSVKENETSIGEFLTKRKDFALLPAKSYEGFREGMKLAGYAENAFVRCIRVWPHKMNGEGHFAALMEKEGASTATCAISKRTTVKIPKEVMEFFKRTITFSIPPERFFLHKDKAYLLPEALEQLPKLRMLRTGLFLGECKNGRFEPSQALAMYLKKEEALSGFSLSSKDGRIIRYLKGETVELTEEEEASLEKGWVLVCTDGFPLGWGKVVNGTIRNKYYPGWRMQ